jgi:hypothetical protein
VSEEPAQLAQNAPAPGSPPKVHYGEVPTFSEGSMVPRAYSVTQWDNHRSRKAENRMGMAPTPKNKREIRSFLGPCTHYKRFISSSANNVKLLTKFKEEKQAFHLIQKWKPPSKH